MTKALPRGWTWINVGQLVAEPQDLTDGPFGSNLKTEHYTDAGPQVIRLQNIGDGQFLPAQAHIAPSHFERLRKHEAKAGDIVVAMLGEHLPRACQVPSTLGPAIVKADCVRLRPDPAIAESRFVVAGLNSPVVRAQADEHVHGVGRPRLGLKWFRTLRFPLAPTSEQQRIMDVLDAHLSRLEDAVASLERAQAKLEAYRASVLKAAVEGRLVPTEAEVARQEKRDYEPAQALLDRIVKERQRCWEEVELARLKKTGKASKDGKWNAKYEEPTGPATSNLPALPEGWCWASMEQLTTRITSGSRDWTQYYDRGTGVFLMAQNVRPGRLDLSFKQVVDPPPDDPSGERSQVEVDDLLVTIVGANTGQVCRVPRALPGHYVCQSVALMRPVLATLSRYLDAYLNSPNGQSAYEEFMYGQGRPHLGFDHLRETLIPLPPAKEQERITDAVEDWGSVTVATAEGIERSLVRARRLRQAVLKWAFEGRLVDQDPADEPAVITLERIRSQRAHALTSKALHPKPVTKSTKKPNRKNNNKVAE